MTRRLPILLVLALLTLSLGVRLSAATIAQYDHALAQVQASLEARIPALRSGEIPTGSPPQSVARRVLLPIRGVGPTGGPQQLVNNVSLWQQLADADRHADVARMQALERQIAALRADLTPAPPATGNDPVQIARAVLAKPEYASDPFPPPTDSERIARWLDAQFSKIKWPKMPQGNGPNFNPPAVSPGFIKGLLIVMVGGAAAVLVAVLVQVLSRRQGRTRPGPLVDAAEAALVEARDTDSLLALAERQAQSGDYRRAFRLVYVATLVSLDTTGVLHFDRAKTNWEYLRALRAAGRDDVYSALTPLTREFDRVWYGFAPAGLPEYARAVAQYRALLAAPDTNAAAMTQKVG